MEEMLQQIRNIINEKGLKQGAVARKAGFSDSQFSALLLGRKLFRAEYVPRVAFALGVMPNDLFPEIKPMEPRELGQASS